MSRYCGHVQKVCDRMVFSQSVTFTDGNLVVNIPAGSYDDGDWLCIVIIQPIPAETTIGAPVVITIGSGTELYPLTNRCCVQVTACGVRSRTKYTVCVATSATGGTFKMLGRPYCAPDNRLPAIDGTAPAEGGAAA